MAPFSGQTDLPWHLRRDAAGTGPALTQTTYLGLGVGVGAAILVAIVVVVVQVVKKHREHKSLVEVLEVEQAVQVARAREIGDVPRPPSAIRRTTVSPLHTRAGWGALSSNETIDELHPIAPLEKRKRPSISLRKRIKQRGIPLKRLKRLTAIMESPRSRHSLAIALDGGQQQTPLTTVLPDGVNTTPKAYTLRKASDADVFVCPGSPKPDIHPSFAIRSPGRYGAAIANNEVSKAPRSHSVGAFTGIVEERSYFDGLRRKLRPTMHMRSVSLGAPPSRPPSCPVPPLPIIEPQVANHGRSARQGVCVSTISNESNDSARSSVLLSSPILTMHDPNKPHGSPTVADVIADDDNASLKAVSTQKWQNPLAARPNRSTAGPVGSKSHASIRSNIATYSNHRLSSVSNEFGDENDNRHSLSQIGMADQVSVSRVSSTQTLDIHPGGTPRKPKRMSVSVNGSPAERKKNNVLRDISGNSIVPSRQISNATQDSERSSNGNPFQWDQQIMPKPSALKGSPNARKGHRRQNCVRISTLTPQVLGPPPSRPTSPNIMHGIEEESGDDQEAADSTKLRFVSNRRLSRPPSSGSFAPSLRIATLRASLTPSSPTLSAWTAYQEHGLPSLPSDSQLSISPIARSVSRQSDSSSAFTIPSFPSPIKPTLSNVQLTQPIPEFSLSRPSTDIQDSNSSPFGLHATPEHNVSSSPPLTSAKQQQYDPAHPAWSTVFIPIPFVQDYDPTTPNWDPTEPERSSPLFPFAAASLTATTDDKEVSTGAVPNPYGGDLPDTPPCSPKTMPDWFQSFFGTEDSDVKSPSSKDKLNSMNASAIMARMLPKPVDFPGAPILSPPADSGGYIHTTPQRPRQRAFSNATAFHPSRASPPPPMPTIPSSDIDPDLDMPSPLHISAKTSPNGPRTQPAQSVLKNALALRRMNSEANSITFDAWDQNLESRRYVRMGREASPLLPWVGNTDLGEEGGDINDLFAFGFAAAGVEEGEGDCRGALDEIDMTEVERKLDGALAGFEAAAPGSDDIVTTRMNRTNHWDDGEKYWDMRLEDNSGLPEAPEMAHRMPKKGSAGVLFDCDDMWTRPKSIQMTPGSLYDSDGFLKT